MRPCATATAAPATARRTGGWRGHFGGQRRAFDVHDRRGRVHLLDDVAIDDFGFSGWFGRRPLRRRNFGRRGLVRDIPTVVVLRLRRFRRLHDGAGEEAHDALPIAFDSKQTFPLACPQQIDEAGEPEFPFIERRVHVAKKLLRLPDVHRPTWNVLRRLEQATDFTDTVCRARLGTAAIRRYRVLRRDVVFGTAMRHGLRRLGSTRLFAAVAPFGSLVAGSAFFGSMCAGQSG